MLRDSAMREVLIPEILDVIFSFMQQWDLYSVALVCVSWGQLALDALWRDMKFLYPLFKILAPMDNGYGEWVRPAHAFRVIDGATDSLGPVFCRER